MRQHLLFAMMMCGAMGAYAQTDATHRIVNPSFESGIDGWTNQGLALQTNNTFQLKAGNTYAEKWVAKGNGAGNASVKQTITNLPAGTYTLTAGAQNIQQDTPNSTQGGVTLIAGNKSTAVGVTATYSVTATVGSTGKLEIGFVLNDAKGNYVCVDNFHLTLDAATAETLAALLTTAEKLGAEPMNAKVQATLAAAIAAGKAVSGETGLTDAVMALSDANIAAKASAAAYTTLKKAIDEANDYYAISPANGADALKTAIDQAETLYTTGEADDNAAVAAANTLKNAVLECHVANGTGNAPTVKSEHFMPVGCIAALGRMTATGTGIIEKGYVWATHPNPTVADNRSTLRYENNGDIYELSPLAPATCYYVRAYAMTKTYAVAYGEEQRIYTLPKATCRWSYGEECDDPAVNDRIRNAVRDACDFYNTWTSIPGFHLNAHYVWGAGAGEGTADCSYGGYMRVSQSVSYQRTGTLLHESNHGVGVGTSHRWKNWDGSNMRADGERGDWLGWRATQMVQFFDHNTTSTLHGDGTHMWPYGINGAHEDDNRKISYIANTLITHAVHQDGLAAVSGIGASPAYTFEHVDDAKYYITSASEDHGAGTAFLYETSTGALKWGEANDEMLKADDSYAWQFEYVPEKAYYRIRNAASGKYFTYSGATIKTTKKTTPGNTENFQLMIAYDEVTVGDDKTVTKRPYLIEAGTGDFTPYTLNAAAKGTTNGATLNLNRLTNVTQRWMILTEEEAMLIGSARVEEHTGRLQELIDGAKAMLDVPHSDSKEGASDNMQTAIDETTAKIPAMSSVKMVQAVTNEFGTAIRNFMEAAYPTNIAHPYDISFLIEDPKFTGNEYWSDESQATPTVENGVAWVEGAKFKYTQSLPDMPKGVYALFAQACQTVEPATAYIYIGAVAYKGYACYAGTDAAATAEAWAQGGYDTHAISKRGSRAALPIGITNAKSVAGDKTTFGNFRLYYYGNDVAKADVEDAITTGIDELTIDPLTIDNYLYDISGRRVENPKRGIYIVNGKKVVVR